MKFLTRWGNPSEELFQKLSPGVVHVWRVPLNDSSLHAAHASLSLSADERIRAQHYRIPDRQKEFIVTRSILRKLLSQYAGVPAANLRLENQAQGKPILTNPPLLPVQFNVSHTKGMALLAFTMIHTVGIDVEKIDRVVSVQNIAARFFSPRESARLISLSSENRKQEFFTYWTCKEAYLKMRGTGLSGGLGQCEIVFDPAGSKAEVWWRNESIRKVDCSLFRVNPGQMYTGAVAVNQPFSDVSFWDWKD
jgi:4'-phosphopantetheinyl transferase